MAAEEAQDFDDSMTDDFSSSDGEAFESGTMTWAKDGIVEAEHDVEGAEDSYVAVGSEIGDDLYGKDEANLGWDYTVEATSHPHHAPSEDAKLDVFALASLIAAVVPYIVFLFSFWVSFLPLLSFFSSVVLGVISLVRISRNKEGLKGQWMAVVGISLASAFVLAFLIHIPAFLPTFFKTLKFCRTLLSLPRQGCVLEFWAFSFGVQILIY